MPTVELEFECADVSISPIDKYNITVTATESCIDNIAETIVDSLDVEDVVKYFGDDFGLLAEIGIDACKEYFDLEEVE